MPAVARRHRRRVARRLHGCAVDASASAATNHVCCRVSEVHDVVIAACDSLRGTRRRTRSTRVLEGDDGRRVGHLRRCRVAPRVRVDVRCALRNADGASAAGAVVRRCGGGPQRGRGRAALRGGSGGRDDGGGRSRGSSRLLVATLHSTLGLILAPAPAVALRLRLDIAGAHLPRPQHAVLLLADAAVRNALSNPNALNRRNLALPLLVAEDDGPPLLPVQPGRKQVACVHERQGTRLSLTERARPAAAATCNAVRPSPSTTAASSAACFRRRRATRTRPWNAAWKSAVHPRASAAAASAPPASSAAAISAPPLQPSSSSARQHSISAVAPSRASAALASAPPPSSAATTSTQPSAAAAINGVLPVRFAAAAPHVAPLRRSASAPAASSRRATPPPPVRRAAASSSGVAPSLPTASTSAPAARSAATVAAASPSPSPPPPPPPPTHAKCKAV
eukprot:Rhum_TRINITY_DN14031_c0_g2::Rhum_TRINITY_DN14031_c0_g2_i1::g.66948::m.66948